VGSINPRPRLPIKKTAGPQEVAHGLLVLPYYAGIGGLTPYQEIGHHQLFKTAVKVLSTIIFIVVL